MQDDQINKSVDDLMGPDVGADATSTQPPSAFSLGTNPSLGTPPSSDDTQTPQTPVDDSADQQPTDQPQVQDPIMPSELPDQDITSADDSSSQDTVRADDSNDATLDDLSQIKKDALDQLSPIVSELDQTPEEKYRTLMMLIQASDDQTLIKSAYEAANRIDDKKLRAEALLNIVNEINYFAGQGQKKED